MNNDRRNFLIQSGTALGVMGLGYLLWDKPAPVSGAPGDAGRSPSPKKAFGELLGAAVRKMRQEHKAGVALRIPADPKERHMPGHVLVNHLNAPTPERDELFAETVIVCLEGGAIQDEMLGADPSHDVFLFNAAGKVLASIPFNYSTDWQKFVETARVLVHGEGNGRLKSRADAILAECEPTVVQALTRLESADDRAIVLGHAPTTAPLLVYEKLQASAGPRRTALTGVIGAYVASSAADAPGPRLPFGVQLSNSMGGCGDCCSEQPPTRSMVACGMGRVGPDARSFVRYLKS